MRAFFVVMALRALDRRGEAMRSEPSLLSRATAAAATFVVAACAPGSAVDGGSFQARDSAGIVIAENPGPPVEARWSVPNEPELSLGVVEGESSFQFDGVRGVVLLDDGRIVVADGGSRQVRFFDPAGGFLMFAGGPGSGPGEFESITTVFRSAGDTLHVYDQVLRRVTVFDPDGHLARTTTVESTTPTTGRLIEMPFGGAPVHAVAGDLVAVAHNASYEIRFLDAAGTVRRIVRSAAPELPVTPDDVRRFREDRLRDADEEGRTEFARILDGIEHGPVAPAFRDLRIDAEGNLWIETFRHPSDDAPDWIVHDPAGRAVARVRTPPGLRIEWIGSDRIGGVWWDDLEVEHVRVHRLEKLRTASEP